ncbi:MAG: hypothetical protein QOJ64_592 [Acidobacteriota bacterium]|jgi:transposase-like protein|nr:hypothetical protein [Acidobacteriota bacterium]
MKTCPSCQRTYPDDNQSNCAYDGSQLSAPYYPPPGQYQQQQYAPPPGQYQQAQYGQPPGANPMAPPPGYPPPGWQGAPPPAYQAGASPYVACPQCRTPDPEKVGFTWWGGMIGPRLLSHVKCRSCGNAYNGKTGNSNTTGIVVYSLILFGIGLAIVLVFVMAR